MADSLQALPGGLPASGAPLPAALQLLAMAGDGRRALMLRHAERRPIRTMDDAWQAPLTDRGRADAHALGRRLSSAGVTALSLASSPVSRCVETARCIDAGWRAGSSGEAGTAGEAGEAGEAAADVAVMPDFGSPFILDNPRALGGMLALGNAAFLRAWFDGGWGGAMVPADEAAESQLDALTRRIEARGPQDLAASILHIVISHDWNIALLREKVLSQRHEAIGLPNFLDGLVVFRRGGRLVVGAGSALRWLEPSRRGP